MKPIEKIFLDILKGSEDSGIKDRILSLENNDWKGLALTAEKNGLFAILYARLLKIKPDNLPAGILSNLKEKYFLNLKRSMFLKKELFEVLASFAQSKIKAAPLKGPVLAAYLYKDIGLRQASCDLDILVKKEQLAETEKLLRERGYASAGQEEDVRLRDYNLKYSGQIILQKQIETGRAYIIELHAGLRGEFAPAPLEYFWESLREITLEGNTILFPSNETLLIYLCLAAMTITEFTELRYIYDIHSLILGYGIDWHLLERLLQNTRYKEAVFFALRLSKELFGTRVPNGTLIKIRPNLAKRTFLKFWINANNVMRGREEPSSRWYYFFTTWHYLASSYLYAKNILEGLRIAAKKIFLPSQEMAVLYKDNRRQPALSLYIKRLLKPLLYLIKGRRISGRNFTGPI